MTVTVSLPCDSHQNIVEPGRMAEPLLQGCHLGSSLEIRGCDFPGQKSLHIRTEALPPKHQMLPPLCYADWFFCMSFSAYCRGAFRPPVAQLTVPTRFPPSHSHSPSSLSVSPPRLWRAVLRMSNWRPGTKSEKVYWPGVGEVYTDLDC